MSWGLIEWERFGEERTMGLHAIAGADVAFKKDRDPMKGAVMFMSARCFFRVIVDRALLTLGVHLSLSPRLDLQQSISHLGWFR